MIDDGTEGLPAAAQGEIGRRRETRAGSRAAEALSDAELVAALIAQGGKHEESMQAARELLDESGGLAGLPRAAREVVSWRGLRSTQVTALRAACELATRLALHRVPKRRPLTRLNEVGRYLALRYERRDQEIMGALYLDARHQHIGDAELYRGVLNRATVEPREILKECLLRGAAAVVLFHTHPSGDIIPSAADRFVTRQMAAAALLVGVELLDHMIIGGGGRWASLKERGEW